MRPPRSLVLVLALALAGCAPSCPSPPLDASALRDAPGPDSPGMHCDPCERIAVCCAPAWGPGCAAVLLETDVTAARCRASLAPVCAIRCADPATVPCDVIREGAAVWCE